jgi:tetratricopeptide (TPR) repeat protein
MEPPSNSVEGTIPCTPFDDDSDYPLGYEQTLDLATQAVYLGRGGPEKEIRKCYFQMAEALARHLVFENPNDPEPRYWYAAALGLRAAEEGGRTQVRLAQRAHEQARLTLTIAPDHAGAQHVLGRLHAAVMRLSGFKRFVATRLLGGKVLAEASWETAESLLAAAARLQPEIPAHHYELGNLYLDTDRPEAALAAFERVVACPPIDAVDSEVLASAGEIVERLRRELEV